MTPIMSLILPIVLSAVAVFILSSIIHMAMPWHKSDYSRVPDEDGFMDAVRKFNLPPGDYVVPLPRSSADMKDPEFLKKLERGPAVVFTVRPPGGWQMGRTMGIWFCFIVLVSAIAACVAGTAIAPGGSRHGAFHYSAAVSAVSYTLGAWPLSIWYGRKWSSTFKGAFDAILYGLATGAIFMHFWPAA